MYLLAGDIGGTKALMGLARIEAGQLKSQFETRLPSADYDSVESLLEHFLSLANIDNKQLSAVTLAVAGPVQHIEGHTHSRLTNLPWTADSQKLSAALNQTPVTIINDFAAVAYALPHLNTEDLEVLQAAPHSTTSPMLAVGAGTGLGISLLDHEGSVNRVYASEGGHVGFSPANQEQLGLLEFWMEKQGHCSREFLLSGPGIARIGEYIESVMGITPGEVLKTRMQEGDPSAAISVAAQQGREPFAERTMQLFADIYASQLGNLALTYLPRGGLYIAGGIAPRILPLLRQSRFLGHFRNKPPMEALLDQIPVSVVTTSRTGLIGAYFRASELVES
jgi:glucokinase